MYDSLGTSHVATVNFTKSATNTWGYAIALPAGDATGTPANNTGTLTFDASGNLLTPTANVTGISFPGLTDGANDLTMSWDLRDKSGTGQIGQSVAASAATASTQDGFASGTYEGFSVDGSGVISASFSNGQRQLVGQVAIATVTNLEGLARVGRQRLPDDGFVGCREHRGSGHGQPRVNRRRHAGAVERGYFDGVLGPDRSAARV